MSQEDEKQIQTAETIKIIRQFNEAFNKQDLVAIVAIMTPDCIFENTYPAPDGKRYVGQQAVRAAFGQFFKESPDAEFITEEMFACGERGVVRWTYHWFKDQHESGHVRGVDIFRVQNGKVAEKLSYVKG
ncbi:MAG: nuclear transport factor 2 family protein [Anaerolineae bacterium]|nr:nuclear transport factor 2 family protein [Anaerolineae bacterium]